MRKYGISAAAGLAISIFPLVATAQDAPSRPAPPNAAGEAETPPDEVEGEAIVVSGQLRGAVPGDIQPELSLSPADVRAYGVGSLSELITELAPQTGSSRGRGGERPVVLLNGRRISDFREIRDLPTEAIERVDILPEEAALKFGYRADQRVVNVVLRPRFRTLTVEAETRRPWEGGAETLEFDVGLLRIHRNGRINLNVEYEGRTALLESERDILPTRTEGLFDRRGNVTAPDGVGEIDPALSAIAGTPVTVAGVPASTTPTLAGFAGNANVANATDVSPYRTLSGPSQSLNVNLVSAHNISPKTTLSLNASLEIEQRESWLGLPTATLALPAANPFSPFATDTLLYRYVDLGRPLERSSNSRTGHAGFTLNGDVATYRWSLTGSYDRIDTRSVTDRGIDATGLQALLDAGSPGFNPFAPLTAGLVQMRAADTSASTSNVTALDGLISGPIAKLPAGDVAVSLRLRGTTSDFDSESFRSNVVRGGSVSRDRGSGAVNIDLPIASRRREVLGVLGDFSLNANAEVETLSDFGTLVTTGYGARWSPINGVRLIFSVTDEEGAPSAQQLGDPVIFTPAVRTFDYVRGETVDITTITGGNPALTADSRHVVKLGLNARPFDEKDVDLSAEWVRSVTRDQISAFPSATAEIEAAFPGRFVRDAGGRLVSVDTRPVNFARAERDEIRWGINFSMPLGSTLEKRFQDRRRAFEEARAKAERDGTPPPNPREFFGLGPGRQGQGQSGQGGQQPPREQGGWQLGGRGPGGGAGGGGGGGFRGLGGPNGALAGRVQFALYHSWRLRDRIVIRDGLPVLDLLDGSATGSNGGSPEHTIELQSGITKDGIGLRLNGKWQSATEVRGGTLASPETLRFGSYATFGLRAFADLGQQLRLVRAHRWLRGMRVALGVDNLFDAQQRVTDRNGAVPLSYQPDLIDPNGRVVRLTVRKLFF